MRALRVALVMVRVNYDLRYRRSTYPNASRLTLP